MITLKIELINENQFRCTLTKEDLLQRHLKISELAYGSEKARLLFREMMQQAATDYGFVAEDIPLMIEAIPMSAECIVLVVTKVTDPEELDTRFSRFTPDDEDEDLDDSMMSNMEHIRLPDTAEEIIDFFKRLYERVDQQKKTKAQPKELFGQHGTSAIATFTDLDSLTKMARDFHGRYRGSNSLYKAPGSNEYTLIMNSAPHTSEEFGRFCFMIPEYGTASLHIDGSDAHIQEHYHLLIKNDALGVLANL